jgi:S-adenosylmethionine decarboxylase
MRALGYHYLIELYDCDPQKIQNADFLEETLQTAVKKSESTEIGRIFHRFSPHGVSGVILISESHFSLHTWPEYGYVAIDLFTCSAQTKIDAAYAYLVTQLDSQRHNITEIKRGLGFPPE